MVDLFVLHLGSDLGVVLLEAIAHALLGGHPLLDAAVDAAGLAGGDGLGGEVVDAGHEAVLDETAESLDDSVSINGCRRGTWGTYAHELLDLSLLHALLQHALLRVGKP